MTMLSNQKRENKTSRGHRAWMKRQKTRKDALLEPGRKAPKFSLKSTPDQKVALDELRGHPLIIAFYPADWSPVCSDQLSLYAMAMPEFSTCGATLAVISVVNVASYTAFPNDHKL